jgi:hypothetical protein
VLNTRSNGVTYGVVFEVSASTARAVGMSSRLIRHVICNVWPSDPGRAEARLYRISLEESTSEVLRKFNPIPIDSSDESALLSGLRVVGPSFA